MVNPLQAKSNIRLKINNGSQCNQKILGTTEQQCISGSQTKTNTVTVENAMKATSDQKQQTPMRLFLNSLIFNI